MGNDEWVGKHLCLICANLRRLVHQPSDPILTRATFQVIVFTGGMARSASRRYLVYSEADFEVFRPPGATRCTDAGEIWHGGSPPPFRPIGATTRV